MSDLVRLVGGGMLLYLGAEWFVSGASALALAFRVPQLVVGLTVVAYGTSAPEIIVGVEAAATGHGAIALGNVVGSNIANLGLILGIAALIRPARVDGALRRRELPVLLASALAVPLVLVDGIIVAWEAAALVGCAVAYTGLMLRVAASRGVVASAKADALAARQAADAAGAPNPVGRPRAMATALMGLLVLLVGGSLFIEGAVAVARTLGMSERLVGVTVVAVGTSLPELVTSVIAARHGHSSLAVGNVVGSNIFNTFLCLGIAGLAGVVGASWSSLRVDLAALLLITGVAAAFIRTERTISRSEGGLLLALYCAFMSLAIIRG